MYVWTDAVSGIRARHGGITGRAMKLLAFPAIFGYRCLPDAGLDPLVRKRFFCMPERHPARNRKSVSRDRLYPSYLRSIWTPRLRFATVFKYGELLYTMAKKGQAQPTRDTAMNPNSPNFNSTSGNAKKSRK